MNFYPINIYGKIKICDGLKDKHSEPTVCVFFSGEQKVNNSGELSPKYRGFSRTLDILFPLKKNTQCISQKNDASPLGILQG